MARLHASQTTQSTLQLRAAACSGSEREREQPTKKRDQHLVPVPDSRSEDRRGRYRVNVSMGKPSTRRYPDALSLGLSHLCRARTVTDSQRTIHTTIVQVPGDIFAPGARDATGTSNSGTTLARFTRSHAGSGHAVAVSTPPARAPAPADAVHMRAACAPRLALACSYRRRRPSARAAQSSDAGACRTGHWVRRHGPLESSLEWEGWKARTRRRRGRG